MRCPIILCAAKTFGNSLLVSAFVFALATGFSNCAVSQSSGNEPNLPLSQQSHPMQANPEPNTSSLNWRAEVAARSAMVKSLHKAEKLEEAIAVQQEIVQFLKSVPSKDAKWRRLQIEQSIRIKQHVLQFTSDERRNFLAANDRAAYARKLNRSGETTEARKVAEAALTEFNRLFGQTNLHSVELRELLVDINHEDGNTESALKYASSAVSIRKELHGEDHPDYVYSLMLLAEENRRANELNKAESLIRKCLSLDESQFDTKDRPFRALLNLRLARILLLQNRFEESNSVFKDVSAMLAAAPESSAEWQKVQGVYCADRASFDIATKDFVVAENNLRQALSVAKRLDYRGSSDIMKLLKLHSEVLRKLDRPKDAELVDAEIQLLEAYRQARRRPE